MVSCNWINYRLLTGGIIESERDMLFLKNGGITHIVNCMRDDKERQWAEKYEIAYLHNGLEDDGKPKPVWWFKRTLDWVLPALTFPGNKFYIHCRGGSNRGPSNAYVVLRAQGMSEKDAEKMIRKVREVGLGYMKDADKAIKELGYGP